VIEPRGEQPKKKKIGRRGVPLSSLYSLSFFFHHPTPPPSFPRLLSLLSFIIYVFVFFFDGTRSF